MAECHPVGFQWVMEAKARGAKVIHVDPRFTRTSAVADAHVPLRAGSDIAFLGGIINHILSNDLYFKEYVVSYTNAATLVGEDFQDTEELDGLFSGYDEETGTYDTGSWQYEGHGVSAAAGNARTRGLQGSGDDQSGQDDPGVHEGSGGAVDDGGEHPASEKGRAAGHELGGRGANLDHSEVGARRDAAAPAHGVPGAQAPLRALHARDGGAGVRRPAGAVPAGLPRRHRQQRA